MKIPHDKRFVQDILVLGASVVNLGFRGFKFLDNLFGAARRGETNFRVQVGLDGTMGGEGGLYEAGGNIQHIIVYDAIGAEIGQTDDCTIAEGDYTDCKVPQTYNRHQAIRTDFYGGDNAVCIASIAVTWSDGSHWGWVGDWFNICHASQPMTGYPSGIIMQGANDEPLYPRCMWLDRNRDPTEAALLDIYWPAFRLSDMSDVKGNETSFCGSEEGMRVYTTYFKEEQIAYPSEKEAEIAAKAAAKAQADAADMATTIAIAEANALSKPEWLRERPKVERNVAHPGRMDERLVISDKRFDGHNATVVCADYTNYGPDFVSLHEGRYCDMDTRKTLPLCGHATDDGDDCFDLDAAKGLGPAERTLRRVGPRSTGQVRTKKPTRIVDWTS